MTRKINRMAPDTFFSPQMRSVKLLSLALIPPKRNAIKQKAAVAILSVILSVISITPVRADGPDPARLSLLGIEITQGIQSMSQSNTLDPTKNNTIPLIRGKKTLVRAYFSRGGLITASLVVTRNRDGFTAIIPPSPYPYNVGWITGGLDRAKLNSSVNFLLPLWLIQSNVITIGPVIAWEGNTITTPMHPNIQVSVCDNCATYPPLIRYLWTMPTLKLRLIGFRYERNNQSFAVNERHYKFAKSWLRRTYPILDIELPHPPAVGTEVDEVDYDTTIGFLFADINGDGDPDGCGRLGQQIALIRAEDLWAAQAPIVHLKFFRTHYVGLVSDEGFGSNFIRGCTMGGPATDASLPAISPAGDSHFGWDDDGSYADWYVSHELGHTLNQSHPTGCVAGDYSADSYSQARDGRISPGFPNDEPQYVGLDFGDRIPLINTGTSIELPIQAIPRNWWDAMSYCPQNAGSREKNGSTQTPMRESGRLSVTRILSSPCFASLPSPGLTNLLPRCRRKSLHYPMRNWPTVYDNLTLATNSSCV